MTLPKPDRSRHQPRLTRTWQKSVVDLGWAEGVMSDGRPYRMEAWTMDRTEGMTFFFSRFGIRVPSDEPWVEDFLERENLVRFAERGRTQATRVDDDVRQPMWEVAVILRCEDQLVATVTIPYREYASPSASTKCAAADCGPLSSHWVRTPNGLEHSQSDPTVPPKFPKPDRSRRRAIRTMTDLDPVDLGWAEGVLSDGRPFRMEVWMEGFDIGSEVSATFFVSREGLRARVEEEWGKFLAREWLVRFKGSISGITKVEEVDDDVGQPLWAIDVGVSNFFGLTLVDEIIPHCPYDRGSDN